MVIFPLLLLLAFAAFISITLKFKMEVSLFLSICGTTLLLVFFEAANILKLGTYLIYILAVAAGIYVIYKAIKPRGSIHFLVYGIISLINPQPILYMDAPMGILLAAICVGWFSTQTGSIYLLI